MRIATELRGDTGNREPSRYRRSHTPEHRAEFLRRECSDTGVREEGAKLLRAADAAEAFFDGAIHRVAASLRSGFEPAPGDRIGAYQIVRPTRRGGMGRVYLPRRADGEVQQVAIKTAAG